MKFTLLFYIMLIAATITARAQCMQYPVPLAERIGGANTIVEGRIISQKSFPAGRAGMIYTRSTIEVYKIFKGMDGSIVPHIDITTEGGTYQNERVVVSPAIELSIGQTGVFFLQEHIKNDDFNGFEPYSWGQCFVQYDEQTGTVSDIFKIYKSINFIYKAITEQTESAARLIKPYTHQLKKQNNKSAQTLAATITGFSPLTTTAGTNSIVTITGSGFGNSYGGQTAVAFASANDGGTTMFSATAPHFVLWTDTEIQVKVPSRAGTGRIRVTSADGSQATSVNSITINYNVLNTDDSNGTPQQTYLVDANTKGGYTITLNSAFAANILAKEAFTTALRTWRCNTFVNIGITQNLTPIDCRDGNDGINVIAFDDKCSLPVGVLGATYYYYSTCNTVYWRLREFDIIFSANASGSIWNYSSKFAVGVNQIDFQSVVLHELGHVHQLGHIISPSEVMHYKSSYNTFSRILAARDIAGGTDVMNRSIQTMPCGPKGITKLTSSVCDNPGVAPSAIFSASPLKGCAPLTVNFTDQSTDSATGWNWDFTNKDEDHTYIQSPTHTYSEPGIYAVKFTASNALGSHSTTKTSYITVYSLPTLDMGKDKNVCLGSSIKIGDGVKVKGAAPYTYSWSPTDFLDNPTVVNPSVTASTLSVIDYWLTITDANGCTATKPIKISPVYFPVISAGSDKSFCRGEEGVTIGSTPTASGGTPPYTFSWSPTKGLDSPTSPNPTAKPIASTTYILTVSDNNNGCQLYDTVLVTVSSLPTKPMITRSNDTLMSTPAATYQWKRDSDILTGETKQFIITTTPGKYTVTTTSESPCSVSSDEFTIESTSVLESVELTNILIYPNPTDGNIEIQLPFAGAMLRLYNVLGMVITEQVIEENRATVSLSDFPSGAYFLELVSGERRVIRVITRE